MEINENVDIKEKQNSFKIEEETTAEENNSELVIEDNDSNSVCPYNLKNQKYIELQNVIKNLSDVQGDEELLKREVLNLNDIYTRGFRHRYSMILNTIQSLTNSQRDLLVVNLEKIDDLIKSQQISLEDSAIDGFEKFYDHIQLDVSRINDLEKRFGQQQCALEGSVTEAKKDLLVFRNDVEKNKSEVSVAMKKMDKLLRKVKKFENEISNAKSEYITILSIFAAVMVACIGGVGCFGNAGKSLMDASMYRFFVFISFVGLIIGNVTFMLLYMVARITDKNIYVNCECANVIDKNNECGVCACNISCSSLQRIKNRLPYIFWYNIVCIAVIVLGICIEHLVLKYVMADWVLILFAFLIVGLSIRYGLK